MGQPQIHPTAIVSPAARLGAGVVVKPYAVVDDHVELGPNTVIGPHAVLHRYVRMGAENQVHAHAVIGDLPQDVSFDGSQSWVEIADDNVIREGVTIHRATAKERPTRLGSSNFLMSYAHIGHDCQVGNGVILTNNVCLGGHVHVEDKAVVGGGVVVHQFCRIGAYTMVAGFVAVTRDVLPYSLLGREPTAHYGLNKVGLRRAGIKGDRYRALEKAYRLVKAGESLVDLPETPEIVHLRAWLAEKSKRGLSGFL